jgi:conjugal transfer mating pair stabilization protein TraG
LLHDHGIPMSKRQIAMDQNGDVSLNLTLNLPPKCGVAG